MEAAGYDNKQIFHDFGFLVFLFQITDQFISHNRIVRIVGRELDDFN